MEHGVQPKSDPVQSKGPLAQNAVRSKPAQAGLLAVFLMLGCQKNPIQAQSVAARSTESPPQNATSPSHHAATSPSGDSAAKIPTPRRVDKEGVESEAGAGRFQEQQSERATPCADLHCYRFASPQAALTALLEAYAPRVVSFGEAHAPAHYSGKTTVARFKDQLFTVLAPQASSLTVEILAPPREGCAEQKQAAKKKSDEITSGQKQSNQNEYIALGQAARNAQVAPDILRASCDDLRFIASPKGGVLAYMETIARLFADELIRQNERASQDRPLTLSYGGALHNDVHPREQRASWSFVPPVFEATQGRYLEVDLIVPELITDSPTWRTFPWYSAYQRRESDETDGPNSTWVIPWGEHSAALIFASAPAPP